MESNIQIVEKPDWVSWEEIHEVLVKAHELNRVHGINMRMPSLPGAEIKKRVEDNRGKLFVALDGEKVVGTGAVVIKNKNMWCGAGDYAYLCFASVLPEYNGQGIYKQLYIYIEREARKMGLNRIMFDTHERNERMLEVNKGNGFVPVHYFQAASKAHYNIHLVKWLDGCPYSKVHCWWQFHISKVRILISTKIIHR